MLGCSRRPQLPGGEGEVQQDGCSWKTGEAHLLLGSDILAQRSQPLQVVSRGQQALNLGHGSRTGRLSLQA